MLCAMCYVGQENNGRWPMFSLLILGRQGRLHSKVDNHLKYQSCVAIWVTQAAVQEEGRWGDRCVTGERRRSYGLGSAGSFSWEPISWTLLFAHLFLAFQSRVDVLYLLLIFTLQISAFRKVAPITSCCYIYLSKCSDNYPSSTQLQRDDNSSALTYTHPKPFGLPLRDLITIYSLPLLHILMCFFLNNASGTVMPQLLHPPTRKNTGIAYMYMNH